MSTYPISELNKVIRGSKRANYNVETIHTILDAEFMCHVGYVWDDQAIVIPMAYGRKDSTIYLHGSLKNRMMLNLLKTEKASITVTILDGLVLARSAFHHSANYRAATVFGTVRNVTDDAEKWNALAYITNHMVAGHWDHVRQPNPKEFKSTLVIALDIETASAKIRTGGVVDETEDLTLPIWAGVVPLRRVADPALSETDLPEGVGVPSSVTEYVERNR